MIYRGSFSILLQEKLYNWILRQQEDGARVTSGDIFAYIQVSYLVIMILIIDKLKISCLYLLSICYGDYVCYILVIFCIYSSVCLGNVGFEFQCYSSTNVVSFCSCLLCSDDWTVMNDIQSAIMYISRKLKY